MTKDPDSVTPDWLLERLLLDELAPERKARVLSSLALEPGGMDRLAALQSDSRATLIAHPPARVAEEVRRRARTQAPHQHPAWTRSAWTRSAWTRSAWTRSAWTRSAWTWAVPALVAVAAVTLVVLPRDQGPHTGNDVTPLGPDDGSRVKGPDRLIVHRDSASGPELLDDGDMARPGDALQLSYSASQGRYGAVVSIDGRGAVTLHFPLNADVGGELGLSGTVRLPEAYRLDDAPGFERFFFVTSQEPVDAAVVLGAAHDLARHLDRADSADLYLPRSMTQTSFIVEKP